MKKHTSSIEEIVANDLYAWMGIAHNCAYKNKLVCPLMARMKSTAKSMETLIEKQKERERQE